MACTRNGSTGFAITSTIEESKWEVRRECGTLLQSCDTGMIEAVIIVPRIEPGGNWIQTAKSGSTDTEDPLNWVVLLVTTVQTVLFDYHDS